jgi:carboxyl-terminal processing protease
MILSLKRFFVVVAIAVFHQAVMAKQADFNEVGKQMAIMLQNSHFARLPFSADLSQRFLDDYIKSLDAQRLYFTQQDVDTFNVKYGGQLHNLLLNENCMQAANEIYEVFIKRVEERLTQSLKLLDESDFDFSIDESTMLSRKNAPWLKSEFEATELWRLQTKKAVFNETLHRNLATKLISETGQVFPVSPELSPQEKVALRYRRKMNDISKMDEEKVAGLFLSAVARAYDPHTDYLTFREMNRFKDSMKNELVGIGVQLHLEEDGAVKITGIIVGGPADRGGILKLNDRIVAVDALNTGKSDDMIDIMFMDLDKVVDLVQGEEGAVVAVKIESAVGLPGESKVVVVQRGKVERKDQQASGQVVTLNVENGPSKRLGVIKLPSFYADFDDEKTRCSVDVEKILNRLLSEKIDGLVLDLRDNPGGSLEEVRRMTGFFIGNGPVVQVKNTLGQVQVKDSDNKKPIYFGPMIVMTDSGSASASEILAGALQDFNRAIIVGDSSTFGKGTVQQPKDIGSMLPYFAARDRAGSLKLTIQKFYRPSGSSTQLDGVIPNIELPSEPNEEVVTEKFLDHALPHDRIRPAGNFTPLELRSLFIPELQQLSRERVDVNKDFTYPTEDRVRSKKKTEMNLVTLSKMKREKELDDSHQLQKERNIEREIRFAKVLQEDTKLFGFSNLTLENVDKGEELKRCHRADESIEYMHTQRDKNSNPDQAPPFPSGLDPVKREALFILRDLIDLTDSARVVGISDGKGESN